VSGDHATPGASFERTNRQGLPRWSTVCAVEVADGRQLVFAEVEGAAGRRTRWRNHVEATTASTEVTESCEPVSVTRSGALSLVLDVRCGGGDRVDQVPRGMQATLADIKLEAEAAPVA
jgi:hypothetical protein